jgi:hypothetical protein
MKKNTRQRNYSIGERSIISLGIISNKTIDEINAVLKENQKQTGLTPRTVNPRSFTLLKRAYLPNWNNITHIWDHVQHPKSMASLKG